MHNSSYIAQVALLLKVLPEVGLEDCFALHGGTAINLFVRDMPRLSVDIDLTYLLLENRIQSLNNISQALERIKSKLDTAFPGISITHLTKESKLIIREASVEIKIEVNQTNRACFAKPILMSLCAKAQEDFDSFCEIQVVEIGHLFGGKICAALDRQHPRDLFDVSYMLKAEGFTEAIKTGFIFYLISSSRPIAEMLFPRFQDQRAAFDNQFRGMTEEPFTYKEFEQTRQVLLKEIHGSLTLQDKQFLMSVEEGEPDWSLYNFKNFPAVQWKMLNIQRLKNENPKKYQALCSQLKQHFLD